MINQQLMIKTSFSSLILCFLSIHYCYSFNCLNSDSPKLDTSNFFKEECIKSLKTLTPSVQAKTDQGNEYSLYAIKKGKEWTYMILDQSGYYSVKQTKGKEEVTENPEAYTDMILMMVKAKMIRKYSKPKNVAGMTFSCYYKFRPKAKTMYSQYKTLQRKVKLANKKIQNNTSGFFKFFKK